MHKESFMVPSTLGHTSLKTDSHATHKTDKMKTQKNMTGGKSFEHRTMQVHMHGETVAPDVP